MRFTLILAALTLALLCSSALAQYGLEFTAPDTFKTLDPDSTIAVYYVHIKNTGSVPDSFRVTFPRQNMPPNWFGMFCDDYVCYDVPFNFSLNPGDTFTNHPHISIVAFVDKGTGWLVCSVQSFGNPNLYQEIRFWCTALTGVEQGERGRRMTGRAVKVAPNPFRERCEISLPAGGTVGIYDGLGRRIRELRAGVTSSVSWDGKDGRGERVPAGVYFFVAESGETKQTGKILRVR